VSNESIRAEREKTHRGIVVTIRDLVKNRDDFLFGLFCHIFIENAEYKNAIIR